MKVERLTTEDVLPIRHQVLWPDKTLSFSKIENDEDAEHFGIRIDGEIVCVASAFTKGSEIRLRKFATLPEFQRKGIGTFLLNYLIDLYTEKGFVVFWFDARESAISFYEKFGFSTEGEKLYKSDVPYFKMVKFLKEE